MKRAAASPAATPHTSPAPPAAPVPKHAIFPPAEFTQTIKASPGFPVYLDDRGSGRQYLWARIDHLVPNPKNAVTHGDRSVESIADSFHRFGQQKPVVVQRRTRVVGAGNGSLVAAGERLGWAFIRVTLTDLEGDEFDAYALADNRSAQHAEWDWQTVAEQLRAMEANGTPINDLGWADYEYRPLLAASWQPPALAPMPTTPDGNTNHPDGEGPSPDSHQLTLDAHQFEAVQRAFAHVRQRSDGGDLTDGAALELICLEWLEQQRD